MPRNDIAVIIGFIVAMWYLFAGPGRAGGFRDRRSVVGALIAFVVAFAITWICLRLVGY
ncbi:hypothetical protein [Alsobacter soli]|uniref:hypothetical protein n=1 Tax=Alsobacter soli TaxID=2109933 RepID=UPI001304AA40|nr:hypothetical protein [Alsobacter soli]